MTILDIYTQYSIPLNLQTHMLRVAAVGQVIADHLTDVVVDRELLIKTLLLHDMGNIIKFDFSHPDILEAADRPRIEELKSTKQQFIAKYGQNADEATHAILREVISDFRIIELCEKSHSDYLSEFLYQNQWEKKISFYSDMRVSPFGVKSVNNRFDNLIERNPEHKDRLEANRRDCLVIEQQLQGVIDFDLNSIDDEMIEPVMKKLESTQI